MHRVIEAELWGVHSDLLVTDDLVITQAAGLYGTLYEITCRPPVLFCRLVDYLTHLLPSDARMRFFDHDEDDEESQGAIVIHYWLEAKSRIKTTATQIGQSAQ